MNRPTNVTVVAVLNLVIGSLQTLCGPIALASFFFLGRILQESGSGAPETEAMARMMADSGVRIVMVGSMGAQILVGLALLVNGIALLGMSARARMAAIVLAVLLTLVQVGGTIASWLVTYPVLRQLQAAQDSMQWVSSALSGLFWTVLYLAYGVAVVVIMTRPAVKQAFAQRPVEFG